MIGPDELERTLKYLRAGIIVNGSNTPTGRRGAGLFGDLESIETAAERRLHKALTATAHEAADRLRQFKQAKIKLLIIAGGDGTVHSTLNAARTIWPNRLPAILILPIGTMNLIAGDVGYPRRRAQSILKSVLNQIRLEQKVHFTPRLSLIVNGRLCFLYGAGMACRFLLLYRRLGSRPWQAVKLAWLYFFKALVHSNKMSIFRRRPVNINGTNEAGRPLSLPNKWPTATGHNAQPVFNLVLCQSVRSLFFSLKPVYFAVDHTSEFGVVLGGKRFYGYLLRLIHIFFHLRFRDKNYMETLLNELHLEWLNHEPYYVDGELHRAKVHHIKKGEVVRFIRCW